jgi:hypothetical protein
MDPHSRAQKGLAEIEAAVTELLGQHPDGLTNGEVTSELGLESDQKGGQENYLAWSVLGRLMKAGTVIRENVDVPGKKAVRSVYKLKS